MIFKLDQQTTLPGVRKLLTVQHDASINAKPWVTNTTKSGEVATRPMYRFRAGLNYANTPNPNMNDVVEITDADVFQVGDQAPFVIGEVGAVWGGSKDDIITHGKNTNGEWTVEFSRRLDTGNGDDIRLSKGQPATFVVIVRDDKKGYAISKPITFIP